MMDVLPPKMVFAMLAALMQPTFGVHMVVIVRIVATIIHNVLHHGSHTTFMITP
jgi:hypothetical protein